MKDEQFISISIHKQLIKGQKQYESYQFAHHISYTPHICIYTYSFSLFSHFCVLFGYLSLFQHRERQRCMLLMDSINYHCETEILSRIRLQDGIILLLSRWQALQMAIKNKWGGCDSLHKSDQLASHIFSCLSKSNCCPLIFLFQFCIFFFSFLTLH